MRKHREHREEEEEKKRKRKGGDVKSPLQMPGREWRDG
jgi:hypothetical protein